MERWRRRPGLLPSRAPSRPAPTLAKLPAQEESRMPHKFVGARLSVMMFLQFFIWGAWYVTTGNFLSSIGWGDEIGNVYALGPIAAMISPLFLGMVADRFFPTQK